MPGKRQSQRHQVEISASARIGDKTQRIVIRNMSLGGAYISTEERLPMETHMEVSFSVPTQAEPILIGARVRWSDDDGAGIQFDGLRAREVWSLNKFFEQA